jgi:hypothetical protein
MGKHLRRALAWRLGLPLVGILAVFGPGAVTAGAASPILQETLPIQALLDGTVPNPCNGQVITWTGNLHVVGGMTTDANGGAVFLGEINFENVHGTDGTGTAYTATLGSSDKAVFAPSSPTLPTPNVETHVIRLNLIGAGSTSNYYEDLVGHYTITPDGAIAVAFEKVDVGCSS